MGQPLLYVLMTGASAVQDRMTATTNNLANANTTAFKAQQPMFQALPFYGQGQPDRVDVATREEGADLVAGPIQQTGRSLDVAVKGSGWIGVQAPDGGVAYTRNGSLRLSASGLLQTSDGHPVLGQGGTAITLPQLQSMTIGEDGTISGVLEGADLSQNNVLDTIMLVNPANAAMQRRTDGLFAANAAAPPDGTVRLQVGALEQSNADSVGMMMSMIENTRMFQMQTEMMRSTTALGEGSSSPLTLT